MSNSTIIVLNPYAQLAWVPPDLAPMLSTKLYSGAGTLAVKQPFAFQELIEAI
jgi:hypothetical protein